MDHKSEIQAIRIGHLLLLKKMGDEDLNASEQAILDQWRDSSVENQNLYQQLFGNQAQLHKWEDAKSYDAVKALGRFKAKRSNQPRVRRFSKSIIRWTVAAAVLLCVTGSIGIYLYNSYNTSEQGELVAVESDASPGTDKAMLTLADGTVVDLNEEQSGIIIGENGIKYRDGHVIEGSSLKNQKAQLLSLRTPAGGQYQVQLSDGTKVWLNAGSELKYPLQFTGEVREVELSGEAYFEVTQQYKNTKRGAERLPFIVRSDKQIIQVLGTSFNVYAYSGEVSKTTLLEGSVAVFRPDHKDRYQLKPYQQLTIEGEEIALKSIEMHEATLWKDGVFNLSGVALQDIMTQVSRWYDVSVSYQSAELKKMNFEGTVPRYENLKSLLSIIEKAGNVSFELKDNTVIVKKKTNK